MPTARVHTQADGTAVASDPRVADIAGTPYQRLLYYLHHDQRWFTEVSLGKRISFYRFRGDLGTGNFSQVKMAIHQLTKENVAVKILDKTKLDPKTRRMLSREIATMEAIHHPNIIRLYEVVESYGKIYLVMEYASGGELFNKITSVGKIAENEAKNLFAQVISAVKYMHDNDFIHRDIKAENVFYSAQGLVKLGDFGFSTQLISGRHQQLNTFCGSPPYAAPELFRDESYLGAPVDIWALGVLLYFMVTAQMPFKAQTVASLKKHILDGVFTIPGHVSFQCRKLIDGILRKAPRDRLSLEEIQRSEWLKSITFSNTQALSERYSLSPTKSTPALKSAEESNSVNSNNDMDGISVENVTKVTKAHSELPCNVKVENRGEKSGTTSQSNQLSVNEIETTNYSLGRQENVVSVERENEIDDIEVLARKKLLEVGITDAMLEEHSNRGARSAIVGTYRIIIHRLQCQGNLNIDTMSLDDIDGSPSAIPSRNPSNYFHLPSFGRRSKSAAVKSKGQKSDRNNRSRTCILL